MDLRSVLNGDGSASAKQHQTSPPQQQQAQQQPPPPSSRPSNSPAQYGGYREYPPGPHPHQSPGRSMSNDHVSSQQQHPYAPTQASPYQAPGPYSRAAPPPLQSVNPYPYDSRSPSGSMPAPSPSPYRQPPTPSTAGNPREYPFPAQGHPEMTSPVQRHQYPPSQQYQHHRHDSYPQSGPVGPGGPYAQQQAHTVPQTPPVGTPGGASQFPPHQRSHSTHSTSTPTSAHSQQHHGPPFHHGSPSSATQPHPSAGYPRPPSQPPTPGGGPPAAHPVSSTRASVGAIVDGPFKQSSSPYQQRIAPPSGPPSQTHPSPHMTSHPPPTLPRSSTSHSQFGSPIGEGHPRPQYLREREQSLSVSPKTRVNPLPPNHAELQHHQPHHLQHPPAAAEPDPKPAYPQNMAIDADRNLTPAKRKMEDRDMSPQDMERKQARTAHSDLNGQQHHSRATTVKSESPAAPKRKRLRRAVPPRWAQSVEILKGGLPKHPNYVLQKRKPVHLNGSRHSTGAVKPLSTGRSRHASPEASRSQQPPAVPQPEGPQDILGPWEPCLTGVKPFEEVSKLVADFLFVNVINCQDIREIQSRGIQFEIEAKLGTVVDRRTNHRVDLGAASECLLEDPQVFKSSMSEENHKGLNGFLNDIVVHAHPQRSGGSRVPVGYKHRREIDRFYDIPPDLQNRLPACMRARFTNNKRPRVRVTHDQQTKELLGKIVKARVADIDLHMPKSVMDCRISINLEMNWDGSLDELEGLAQGTERQPDRNKDRLSYSQGPYQVDLTQVTQSTPQGVKKEHELEIELAPGILIDQGRKALSGAPHRYPELIEGLIDNVRLLARKARDV